MEQKPSTYNQLLEDAKAYLSTRYDLLRLELLDKLSSILGMLVLVFVMLFLVFGALAYLSVALVSWMAKVMPVSVSCLVLAGVLIIAAVVLYLLRERLFINKFVGWLSQLLFAPSEQTGQSQTENKSQSSQNGEDRVKSDSKS